MRNPRVIERRAGTPLLRSLAGSARILRPTELLGRSQMTWNAMAGDNLPTGIRAAPGYQGIVGGLAGWPTAVVSAVRRQAIGMAF